jgi:hypothetical protein
MAAAPTRSPWRRAVWSVGRPSALSSRTPCCPKTSRILRSSRGERPASTVNSRISRRMKTMVSPRDKNARSRNVAMRTGGAFVGWELESGLSTTVDTCARTGTLRASVARPRRGTLRFMVRGQSTNKNTTSKRLPAALARRAVAASSAKLARVLDEATRDIALIRRRRAEIADAFYDIGEALVRLKRREVVIALGCRPSPSFARSTSPCPRRRPID